MIPTFRGAFRAQRLLESVLLHDPAAFSSADWLVVEDPSDERATDDYRKVLRDFPVSFIKLPTWSNMHGAAHKAFVLAATLWSPDWVLYLGDDLLVSPNAISSVIYFLQANRLDTIGLVQIPYWNAHDLCEAHRMKSPNAPVLLRTKEDMYLRDPEWLTTVPRNPHWEGAGYARPYVNVNGVGFAARLNNYFAVGGFAEGTWCLDESISVRTWLRGALGCIALPGPCVVHYFAGTHESTPAHNLDTPESWNMAMGMTKEEADLLCRGVMARREPQILAETRNAKYWYFSTDRHRYPRDV